MSKQKYDFGGWATKNDLLCADGRTIRKGAFKDDDGRTVPLVWQHNHEDPTRVIGHALLENRDDGVYAYGTFNSTDIAQHVKELVRHGDVCSLSIYANKLKQTGGDVIHGVIREVSVVLAGANPGAMIEFPIMEHGEESETEAVIWTGDEELSIGSGMSLSHEENSGEGGSDGKGSEESKGSKSEKESGEDKDSKKPEEDKDSKKSEKEKDNDDDDDDDDEEEVTVGDVLSTMTEKQRAVTEQLVEMALDGVKPEEVKHADTEDDEEEDGDTVGDVLESMTPEQRKVVEFLVAQAIAANEEGDEEDEEGVSHSIEDDEEETTMANVFENNGPVIEKEANSLTHAQLMTLQSEMKKSTLKEAVLAHSQDYGIEQIDYLMPEYKEYRGDGAPQFIKRENTWVAKVMGGVHHTPFSKVKMTFADITADEARARGYIKGNRKKEEVFGLLKREVSPITVYKKQKIDKDDEIDLSNGFNIVAWLKSEMRMMLDEELARAYIIGDGRTADSDDKIREDKIIPVLRDDSLFVIRRALGEDEDLVDAVTYATEDYQGSGNCIGIMTRRQYSKLKLQKDKMGRRLYANDSEIASALGVREIIFMPQMADSTTIYTDNNKTYKPLIIILDLDDYNVGADRGGSINMFEDFDIDYNQQKYLIETRCSGALTKPYSAIVIGEEVNPQ